MIARPIERKVTLWLCSLAALTAFNVGLWIWIARSASLRSPYADAQLLLSGVYVAVCGFRSLFPRVDLERVCLWDTWLSGIMLGRTAATIAELCFALQCSFFVQRLADITGMPLLEAGAHAFLPLAVLAQLLCWYAVLSLNHIGHAIEESLWALMMLILSAASGAAAFVSDGPLRTRLIVGCLVYGVGAGLTMAVRCADVRPPLADAGRGHPPDPCDGTARQPASPAADLGVGGLARRSALDDALFQRRGVDEPGDGAPGMSTWRRSRAHRDSGSMYARRPATPALRRSTKEYGNGSRLPCRGARDAGYTGALRPGARASGAAAAPSAVVSTSSL